MKKSSFALVTSSIILLAACTQSQTNNPRTDAYSTNSPDQQNTQIEQTMTPQNTPLQFSQPSNSTSSATKKETIMKKATLQTNFGNITIEFYPQDAPKTVENFQKLANSGFYNNLTFHRVIKGFMIQGGDPSGNGTGGPGYSFEDEINKSSDLYKTGYKKGIVAMANAGPNTNGSQFFIMHQDYPLPPNYTIFAKVIEGQEIVDKIANTPTDSNDKPQSPVIIQSVKLFD